MEEILNTEINFSYVLIGPKVPEKIDSVLTKFAVWKPAF